MTCDQIQPLLEAFAGHDLSPLTRWRIRRHLTQCPACTAELAESVALTTRVRAWQNVPAPAGLEARIAAALPAVAPIPARPPLRRAAVGLAGLAAALAAAVWLVPGQPGRPTVAFAEVEQAMQNVQIVSWRTTQHIQHKPGDSVETLAFTTWVRRHPAAIAFTDFVTSPGLQSEMGGNLTLKSLTDSRGYYDLTEKDGVVAATHTPASQIATHQINQMVTRQIKILTQPAQITDSLTGQVKTVMTNFYQRNVIVDGDKQIRFDRDFKTTKLETDPEKFQVAYHITEWVNPATHRLVRLELRYMKDTTTAKPFTTMVEDHFQYNTPLPPGVFDWSPPPGIKIRHKL